MVRLDPAADLPPVPVSGVGAGTVRSERKTGEVYEADYDAAVPAFVVFRMTWHPKWKVYVDGRAEPTMMLSPGVLGVRTAAGRHHVLCRYEAGMEKIGLLLAGVMGVILGGLWERRGRSRGKAIYLADCGIENPAARSSGESRPRSSHRGAAP
jgi:hypothetical protein